MRIFKTKSSPDMFVASVTILMLTLYGLPASAADSQTIRFGSILDLSGPASVIGIAMKQGQEVAINVIDSDRQKYLCSEGRSIQLTWDDATNSQTIAVTIARNYVASGNYTGIIGPVYIQQAQAIAQLTSAAKIPLFITITQGTSALTGLGEYVFAQSQSDESTAATAVAALLKAWPNEQTIGILYASDAASHLSLTPIVEQKLTAAGKKVVKFSVPFASQDLTSAIATLKSQGAQSIYMLLNATAQAAAMQQASRVNYKPHWFGNSNTFATSVPTAGGAGAEGTLLTSDYAPDLNSDLVKQFQTVFQTQIGKEPDSWAALGFQSVITAAAAICKVEGRVTPQNYRDALAGVDASAVITGGRFKFDGERLSANPPAVLQIKNGQFVTWKG